ncbi:MAG TPA: endolytic transglycosylase MltG [Acidimicrobiia bacterium]|nr:endolytic transglycosylase MltG [Acidimicrobiia bacterium]
MSLDPVPPPPSFSRLGRIGAIVALVVVAGVAIVGGASFLGRQVGGALGGDQSSDGIDVEPGLEVEVVIPSGASAQDISAILAGQGVVASAVQFEAAVRSAGASGELKAGTYQLVTGMDSSDVLAALRTGPLVDVFRITVREGLRVEEITEELAENSGIPLEDFVAALEGGDVTTELRQMPESPQLSDWEGLLFPDTYEFSQASTAASMLQRMASTMEERVGQVDWSGLEEDGYDRYEGIVIASLIESEVRVADERPVVSSVIHNRLDEEMLLQIDATVLYALDTRSPEDFDPEVDSPYNTYRFTGLPPTPIAAPGLAALEAAANPDDTEFLYYVLSAPDGSHTFTTNLDDHNEAVRQAREDGVLP